MRLIAEGEAKAGNFDAIYPEHLWMGLTKLSDLSNDVITGLLDIGQAEKTALLEETDRLRKWFAEQGIETIRLRRKLRGLLGKGKGTKERLHRSAESLRYFEKASQAAEAENTRVVNMLHLNRAILDNPPSQLAEILIEAGYRERINSDTLVTSSSKRPESDQQSILEFLGRDLTTLAARDELLPLIGRRDELRRLAQILIQKRKGNALLVGEAGVGKTCLVEGLAQRIVSPACVPAFRDKRIIELSMTTLLAGTMFRGTFEARLDAVIREAESHAEIILFLDEIHTIMIQGDGGLDAANILKPALARGKLHVIGATTTQQYERYFARDDAISRRFETLWVEEPSRAETIEILSGAKSDLEDHYELPIMPAALEAAVKFSIRYMPDRKLPDKAFDLIDQACAQKALQSLSIKTEGLKGAYTVKKGTGQVGREDIARVISTRCRVPYELLLIRDQERLDHLEEFLSQRIIGQQKAIRKVSHALQASYQGLKDPRRPVASFLFTGPTGVGKTETAKVLAEFLFGTAENLFRIDLSEYTERHQVSRLLGAPPGYVGYEDPGVLTSALRARPASVALFDEIEKAHPDVLRVFLNILDEGGLTDGQGREASFREAIVILTSNIAPETGSNAVGFNLPDQHKGTSEIQQKRLIDALHAYLRPELIGRIGHIIRFESLTQDSCLTIAENILQKTWSRLQGGTLNISEIPEELWKRIKEKIPTLRFGARDIERLVESEITAWLIQHRNLTKEV